MLRKRVPREYVRRPDALRERLNIPISEDMLKRLRVYAAMKGTTPTTVARGLISENLPDVPGEAHEQN